MRVRVITGAVLLALLVPVLYFSDTPVYPAAWALLALVGCFEFLKTTGVVLDFAVSIPGFVLCGGMPLAVYFWRDEEWLLFLLLASLLVYLLYLFTVAVLRRMRMHFDTVCISFVGVMYIAFGFTALVLLRWEPYGNYLFGLVFVGAWITDTFAYFCGRLFGRHKLIVEISPKKTVEGSIGGTLFCVGAFLLYGLILQVAFDLSPRYVMLGVAGLLAAFISQIGDLIASLIKREHGVKDYGFIFPGHGGVLDRFDSILAIAPLLWILLGLGETWWFTV